MQRISSIALITLSLTLWGAAASAQDCRFKVKTDESFKQAMNNFHEVMSGLVHGAAGKGDFSQVKAKAEALAKLRDSIMAANLPEKMAKRCPEISIKAAELSKAVDNLVAQSRSSAGDDAVKLAFDNMHTAYRNLNNALVSVEDQLQAFHEVMHPLWHDAYPKKDAAAIKAEVPKLKVRAKLILSTAEAVDKAKVAGANRLLEAVTTLEEAAAANDDASVLEALRVAHEVYENLASGAESRP